jgi:hypothetical protein
MGASLGPELNENHEDVVHVGILSKISKYPGIQADFVIRHQQVRP